MLPVLVTRSCKNPVLVAAYRNRNVLTISQINIRTSWRRGQRLTCKNPSTFLASCGYGNTTLISSSSSRNFSTRPSASNNEDEEEEIVSTYSRISPLEHILLRPGMYIGPAERLSERCMILDPKSVQLFHPATKTAATNIESSSISMTPRITQRNPALLKIFDEILVNASDNRLRSTTAKTKTTTNPTTKIDVTIDPGCIKAKRNSFISIRNNGQGIPIRIHETEKIYIPEMVFGHLLTGSNFHDEHKTKRLTGIS
jgi:hypothetical protein